MSERNHRALSIRPPRRHLLGFVAALVLIPLRVEAEERTHAVSGRDADVLSTLLEATPAGRWIDLVNTRMANVVWNCGVEPCPGNGPLGSRIHGNTGPASIMGTWSGATLDTTNERLIIWGGGHNDYYGNEVYAFNLTTLTWSELSQPSSRIAYTGGPVSPDGAPASSHSYDALTYLPGTNQMFVGSINDFSGNSYPNTFLFNLTTHTWQQVAKFPGAAMPGSVAAYDPADGNVYEINNAAGLAKYDPSANTWTVVGNRGLSDYHMTGAIDPAARLLVAAGGGRLNVVNLTTGAVASPTASGDLTVQKANAPGLVWDSAANLFVGWDGGSTLYTLDPNTWRWSAHRAATGNTVVPTAAAQNGTFGRFQYDAAHNVFIAVNDINQDVYVYKPDF